MRTRLGLMAELMAEASGQPIERFAPILAQLKAAKRCPGDAVLTEAEYLARREELRKELPGILRWMVEGAVEANALLANPLDPERN